MKKKILVLGATGKDGSLICKFLVDKKFEVYGLARKSATGNLKNLKDLLRTCLDAAINYSDHSFLLNGVINISLNFFL